MPQTPKQFVQGYYSDRVKCVLDREAKTRGERYCYSVVQPSFPKEWSVIASGVTPMHAWAEAARSR